MGYVYLCFSMEDRNKAFELRNFLATAGIESVPGMNLLLPSGDCPDIDTGGIVDCKCVLFLLSNSSHNSWSLTHELEFAEKSGKTIITVKIEDLSNNNDPLYYLADKHMATLDDVDLSSPEIQRVLTEIKSCMETVTETPTNKWKRIEYVNNDVYEGEVSADDRRDGKGKYFWKNGDIYEGDFANDQRTGKGKMIFANGDVYEGDFIYGKFNGKGRYSWINGDVYEGDYVNDKRNGKGKFVYADGDVYEGDFVDGEINGYGKYTFADGVVQEGEFADGEFIG